MIHMSERALTNFSALPPKAPKSPCYTEFRRNVLTDRFLLSKSPPKHMNPNECDRIATWEPDAQSEGDHVQSVRGRTRFARRAPSIWAARRYLFPLKPLASKG